MRNPIVRSIPIALAAALLPTVATQIQAQSTTSPLALECELLDTQYQPVSQLAPGDAAFLRVRAEMPPGHEGARIVVKLGIRFKVAGISVAYALDEFKLSAPNQSPIPEWDDGLPLEGVVEEYFDFKVPEQMPPTSATLKAKAAVDQVGKASCRVDLEVTD